MKIDKPVRKEMLLASSKQVAFAALRYSGVCRLVRYFYRHKLLILCYHGISVKDEHEWWPGVFMEEKKFQSRMALVKALGFTPLSLDAAVNGIKTGDLPSYPIVITADDGYLNSPETLGRVCTNFGIPLTIYVTSYHAEKQSPVFNATIHYLMWKAKGTRIKGPFPDYFGSNNAETELVLTPPVAKELTKNILVYGRDQLDDPGRCRLIEKLAEILGVDYPSLKRAGAFHLMDSDGIKNALSLDVDIQLHTHRHRFPMERNAAFREVRENRAYLERITNKRLEHFCYPSGRWHRDQWRWLEELGVLSATTCRIGFNDKNSHPLALNRYLDKNTITTNEFIAEVSGTNDLIRSLKKRMRPAR